jgi:rare lipoprotein A (peptidoglycan hydrolase)
MRGQERAKSEEPTAVHRTLAFGTSVLATNRSSVTVRIND